MDNETTQELKQLRCELDEKFGKIDQRFEQIDQRFELIDQKFERIERRFDAHDEKFRSIDREFRVVHTSINKLAQDFHYKCLADEERHATVLKMFDTIMHKLEPLNEFASVKAQVERHETRISAIESAVRKS
jgi:archaellum component FlaC